MDLDTVTILARVQFARVIIRTLDLLANVAEKYSNWYFIFLCLLVVILGSAETLNTKDTPPIGRQIFFPVRDGHGRMFHEGTCLK